MKHLITFILFCLSLSFENNLFSQNITVSPNPICYGQTITVTINRNIVPTGKNISYAKFIIRNSYMAMSIGTNNIFTFPSVCNLVAGTWPATGEIVTTDSIHYNAGTVMYTVYSLPLAKFFLSNNIKDTQCAVGNSFCFIDSSYQSNIPPSIPVSSRLWFFGDNLKFQDTSRTACHHFDTANRKYNVTMYAVDSHGCVSYPINPISVFVKNGGTNLIANRTGKIDCFGEEFILHNYNAISLSKIQNYCWKITSADSVRRTAPFNLSDSFTFDSIRFYFKKGSYFPALFINDTAFCNDTSSNFFSISAGTTDTIPVYISGLLNVGLNSIRTYYATHEDSATYFWKVNGGNMLSNNGYDSIQVKWTSILSDSISVIKTSKLYCLDTAYTTVTVTPNSFLNDFSFLHEINLFPNPANKEITIKMDLLKPQDISINIVDATGKVIYEYSQKNIGGTYSLNIPVDNFKNGIYFLEISNGETKNISKLLIE